MRYVEKIIFKTIGNAGIVNGNVPVLRFGSNLLRVKISSTSTKRRSSPRGTLCAGCTIYGPMVLSEIHTIDAEGNKRKKNQSQEVYSMLADN